MVDTAVIHLEGDAIRWYNWLEYNYGVLTWIQSDRQLLGTFIEGLKPKIKGEVKVRQPRTVKAVIAFARIQEKRLNQDAQRIRTTSRLTAYEPPSASRHPLLPKILTSKELRDRSNRGIATNRGVAIIVAKRAASY
ncbi:hypothetical protein BHE74_00049103 [Ensete ventricosum]|nr:hypothetical protein BHE74_00049103 [Ensete ventricosum]